MQFYIDPDNCEQHKRRPWTQQEKQAVEQELGVFLRLRKCPGKSDIEKAKEKNDNLKSRDWRGIKYYVKNINSKKP